MAPFYRTVLPELIDVANVPVIFSAWRDALTS